MTHDPQEPKPRLSDPRPMPIEPQSLTIRPSDYDPRPTTQNQNHGREKREVRNEKGKFLAPSLPCPTLHDGENFLPHPRPLGPRKTLPHLVKLYFMLIFPTTITIFSNKMTCFNNKNILEIINKFILSNQTNFQQKLNNII